MLLKKEFEFVESSSPITEPISKFGGQPVWINTPHWPIDSEKGNQMLFMGQIAFDVELFPRPGEMMAYLFISGSADPLYNQAIGIVIQSKDNAFVSENTNDWVKFTEANTGPSIFELDENREPVYKEYSIKFGPLIEEKEIAVDERVGWEDLDLEDGYTFTYPELAGKKIGGQPLYIEGKTVPHSYFTENQWINFLQLAPLEGYRENLRPNFYPFYMEMGEFGILNIFLSEDFSKVGGYVQGPS